MFLIGLETGPFFSYVIHPLVAACSRVVVYKVNNQNFAEIEESFMQPKESHEYCLLP